VLPPGALGESEGCPCVACARLAPALVAGAQASNAEASAELGRAGAPLGWRPLRPKQAQRTLLPSSALVPPEQQKRVASGIRRLARLCPKSLHVVTAEDFALQGALFVVARSIDCDLNYL
jgi:hypothetical protein